MSGAGAEVFCFLPFGKGQLEEKSVLMRKSALDNGARRC